jgi:glycosyltransferase involved in cell wall biosynthesis
VAGDAALLINPYDTREMAEAMRRLDADEELRNSLVAKGEKQVQLYSEEKYKSRLAELYGRILGPKKFPASQS